MCAQLDLVICCIKLRPYCEEMLSVSLWYSSHFLECTALLGQGPGIFLSMVISLYLDLPPSIWIPAPHPHHGQAGLMLTCHPQGVEDVYIHWIKNNLFCCCAVVFIIITGQGSDYQQGVLAQDSPWPVSESGLQAAYSPLPLMYPKP